jgi:hypothetical protein
MAKKKLYLADHMNRKGFSHTDVVNGAPVSFRTLRRMMDGEEFYVSTLKKVCEFIGIDYEDVWVHPDQLSHAPPGKKEVPIDNLPNEPNATILGHRLNESQRRALKYMIEGFKEELENELHPQRLKDAQRPREVKKTK